MKIWVGLMIPFLGTSLGALMVFLMKEQRNGKAEKGLLGFAAGIMMAASVWSLLIPSMEMAREQGIVPWLPAAVGFLIGVAFLRLLDKLLFPLTDSTPERIHPNDRKIAMLLAITLHNIPEGMAVGIAFSGAMLGDTGITMAAAFALSVGIAIQNFPEGAIVSMPLKSAGMSKPRAFTFGVLSGAVEPVGALLTILLTSAVKIMLPYLLSFAAGAMICVVIAELIPEAQNGEHAPIATFGTAAGFLMMMILDVSLG